VDLVHSLWVWMVGGVVGVGGCGEEGLEWGFEGDHRVVVRAKVRPSRAEASRKGRFECVSCRAALGGSHIFFSASGASTTPSYDQKSARLMLGNLVKFSASDGNLTHTSPFLGATAGALPWPWPVTLKCSGSNHASTGSSMCLHEDGGIGSYVKLES
jgi:hypothetical protein